MDLIKIDLPSYIELEGFFYDIRTDFRDWLKFARLLNDEETTLIDLDYIYINEKPADRQAGFKKLLEFYNPPRLLPRPMGKDNGEAVLDYDLDADLIYSAFYEVYKIDLLATDETGHALKLHWHKFQTLLGGLHDTKLNEVMGYRCYNPNDKGDYKKQMQQLKSAWALPIRETKAEKKAREEFNALFTKKITF